MIHANRIVTVGEQECIIDRPIVLYRGDREVEIEFTLVGNEFTFSEEGNVIKSVNASHGQLVLNTPSGEHMFSELAECHEGKVVFVVTKEMIDEFIEMGFYSFQIRLYDSAEMKSRVTIPPVMNGFDIRNPIAAEDETNVVDQGIVDYARIFKDQSNEELPTFTWDGEYVKTEWVHHDVITENKLNKIEDALYSINANIKESDVVMLNTLDQVKKDADAYVKEHMAEVEADVEEFERNLNTGVEQFKIDTNAAMTAHKNEVSEELESVSSQLVDIENNMVYVNIKEFGAVGDGITDDTVAIQNAIDYCSSNNLQLKLNGCTYKVSNSLLLKSNTNICGQQGCEIYFPPCEDFIERAVFYSDRQLLKNVEIRNIKIHSENILKGSGFLVDDLVSYVQGISIYGGQNIRIIDVTMECMTSGLKFGFSGGDLNYKNKNIYVDNLVVMNSCTPMLLSNCERMTVNNTLLDASASASSYMHCVYAQRCMFDIVFNNIVCQNSPGGGIHIFQEGMNQYPEEERADRYYISNITCNNCKIAMYLWSVDNVTINNFYAKDCEHALSFSNSSNIQVNNFIFENITKSIMHGASRNIIISNGFFDCSKCTLPVLGNDHIGSHGIVFDNIACINISSAILFGNTGSDLDIIVKNSIFRLTGWTGNEQISVRHESSRFLFLNNIVYKECTDGKTYIYYSPIGTNSVIFKDNTFYGSIEYIKPANGNYEYCAKSINNYFVDTNKFITDQS